MRRCERDCIGIGEFAAIPPCQRGNVGDCSLIRSYVSRVGKSPRFIGKNVFQFPASVCPDNVRRVRQIAATEPG